jgi:NTP pyrophosphatase (non-canonical NTP hydrolase)
MIIGNMEFEDGQFKEMFEEYAEFVDRGVSLADDNPRERLLLGALGLAGESGEVVDEIKKHVFHGKVEGEVRDNLVKELGDVLWYYTLLLSTTDITLDEVMEANVVKLTARYPHKHGVQHSHEDHGDVNA